MKRNYSTLLYSFVILLTLGSCENDPQPERCMIEATVVDLTGLDGCGFVFQDDSGTRYEPIPVFFCGTGLSEDEIKEMNPMGGFVMEHGKRVSFSYEPIEVATICMAGIPARITCFSDLESESSSF